MTSENIHGATYASATRKSIRSRTLPPVRAGSSGIQSNEAQYPEDRIPGYSIPGYSGYSIPGYSGFVAAVKVPTATAEPELLRLSCASLC